MANGTDIERIVMQRIRLIRILRLIISTMVLSAFTFSAALWGIGKEVWVARVFENAPLRIEDLPNFYIAAFFHAHFIVQVLAVLTLASFAYLLREIVRLIMEAIFGRSS